jgi:nicotinamidase-related amidase
MIRLPRDAGLIIIDVQKGFDDPRWGPRNNPDAEQKIARLLAAWRENGRPVFHVQHLSNSEGSPLHPRNPGCEIKEIVRPVEKEQVFQKRVNSAFIGTQLESSLHQRGIRTVLIVGFTTPHCVSTSVRMAANLGFEVYMASDAIAAFELVGPDGKRYSAEEVHSVSLATLHQEFATVVDSKTLLDSIQQT